MQQEIVKNFIAKINSEQGKYPNMAKLKSLYDENKKDEKHFNFDEMRLVEEVLI